MYLLSLCVVRSTQILVAIYLCIRVNEGWSYQSIIGPQAFGRLRPVSSLLGLISQSQPKNSYSSIYKRFMNASIKQPFAGKDQWYTESPGICSADFCRSYCLCIKAYNMLKFK